MPRYPYGYGSRYKCPDCHQSVNRAQPYHKVGPWSVHPGCKILCVLCGELMEPPPIGKAHTIAVWCDEPVHTACKEAQ